MVVLASLATKLKLRSAQMVNAVEASGVANSSVVPPSIVTLTIPDQERPDERVLPAKKDTS